MQTNKEKPAEIGQLAVETQNVPCVPQPRRPMQSFWLASHVSAAVLAIFHAGHPLSA